MVMPTETSKGGSEGAAPFELAVKRVPTAQWGCGSAETNYDKKYKVGQGSYGWEVWMIG
jgi:hypothetical protein